MHEVRATKEIAAPKSEVWAVLDDFGGVATWDPTISSSRIVDGPETGEGATRECELQDGDRAVERIVEYDPESRFKEEFVDMGSKPVKEFIVEWSVEALGDSRTQVTLKGRYRPSFGPIGWVLAKVLINSKMEAAYCDVLDALADHVENQST